MRCLKCGTDIGRVYFDRGSKTTKERIIKTCPGCGSEIACYKSAGHARYLLLRSPKAEIPKPPSRKIPRCKVCNQKLHREHPFNSQLDMDICINPECPIKRRPQGYTPNPKNAKIFKPLTPAQEAQRECRNNVVKAGITVNNPTDGRHYRFKD